MSESWLPIRGYVGFYEVSSLGRVRSLDRMVRSRNGKALRKGKILKSYSPLGYNMVRLSKNNKQKNFAVHRLVAFAFLNKCRKRNFVNHIDGNKLNNNADNLEWVTTKENFEHAVAKNLTASCESHGLAKLNVCQVIEIYKRSKKGENHRLIASDFSISPSNVSLISLGKTWWRVTGILARETAEKIKEIDKQIEALDE